MKELQALALPNEIWAMIFDLLEDPEDLSSCFHTCSRFKDLLRNHFMAEGFRIMQDHLIKTGNYSASLTNSDILNCRLVCRQWKSAIDHFLRNHPHHHHWPAGWLKNSLVSRRTVDILRFPSLRCELSSNGIEKIKDMTTWCRRNYERTNKYIPVPSRRLIVHISSQTLQLESAVTQEQVEEFKNAVLSFLQLNGIGTKFWHLEYKCHVLAPPIWFHFVIECLKLMPNLKTFSLGLSGIIQYYAQKRALVVQLAELQDFLEITPFPRLRNLVTVHLKRVPGGFLNDLLLKNPAVKKLVTQDMRGDHWLEARRPDNLPMLEEFEVIEGFIPRVPLLERFNWPLTKLTVNINASIAHEDHSIRTFMSYDGTPRRVFYSKLYETFTFFAKFGDTLKELCFSVNWPEEPDTLARLPDLPHLQKLKIEFLEKVTLDLVLPIWSLEVLEVELHEKTFNEHEEMQVIQFQKRLSHLHKSNLWERLPGLKTLNIDTTFNSEGRRTKRYSYSRRCGKVGKPVKYYFA